MGLWGCRHAQQCVAPAFGTLKLERRMCYPEPSEYRIVDTIPYRICAVASDIIDQHVCTQAGNLRTDAPQMEMTHLFISFIRIIRKLFIPRHIQPI